MSKPFFRSLLVGLVFLVAYYAVQTIHGMYLTMNYVPDIVDQYASAHALQERVAIGQVSSPIWRALEAAGAVLAGIGVYYAVRLIRRSKM